MVGLLKMSSGLIDGTVGPDEFGPVSRINFHLSEIGDGIVIIGSSHSYTPMVILTISAAVALSWRMPQKTGLPDRQ